MRNTIAISVILAGALLAPGAPAPSVTVQVEACRKDLRSGDAEKRRVAAIKLGWLGPKAEPALPDLMEALSDPDDYVAQEASNTLVRIGPKAVPHLARALSHMQSWVRWQAIEVLLRLGPDAKDAVPALARQVKEGRVMMRILAAMKLGRLGPQARKALPALLKAVGDRGNLGTTWYAAHPSSVCEAAVLAIRAIDPGALKRVDRASLKTLLAMLRGDDHGERQAAAGALALLGPAAAPAVPVLKDLLLKSGHDVAKVTTALAGAGKEGQKLLLDVVSDAKVDIDVRRMIMRSLAFTPGLGPEAIRRVTGLLSHPDQAIRSLAAMTLASQGPAAEEAIPALIAKITDPGLFQLNDRTPVLHNTRYVAAEALSRIGPKAVPPLIEALKSEGKREPAIIALGRMGPVARDARKALRKYLDDRNRTIALQAAGALLRLGEKPEGPIAVLVAGLSDPDKGVHSLALNLLWFGGTERGGHRWALSRARFGEPALVLPGEATRPLLEMLKNENLRGRAANLLGQMKGEAGVLVPPLVKLLDEARLRTTVLPILGDLGPAAAGATPAIIRVLKADANGDVQRCGLRALAGIGPRASAAVPLLLKAIANPKAPGRDDALHALGIIGAASKEAIDALVKAIRPDPKKPAGDGYRRSVAVLALGRAGPAARAALADLRQALLDRDPIMRVRATYAMAAITGDTETYLPLLLLAGRDTYDVSDRYPVMEFVLETLEMLGPKAGKATPWLVEQLDETGDVRADEERIPSVIRVLAAIGPGAKASLPALKRLAGGKHWARADLAARVIRQIERRK
jgi:HEAT repeat protein